MRKRQGRDQHQSSRKSSVYTAAMARLVWRSSFPLRSATDEGAKVAAKIVRFGHSRGLGHLRFQSVRCLQLYKLSRRSLQVRDCCLSLSRIFDCSTSSSGLRDHTKAPQGLKSNRCLREGPTVVRRHCGQRLISPSNQNQPHPLLSSRNVHETQSP